MSSLVKVEMYALDALLEEKKQLIKNTVCKGATDDELLLFLHVCKRVGLDPLMRQIYYIPRGKDNRTIQTGIDGFRLIAERTGNYSPGKEPTYVNKADGTILSCTAYVLKRTDKAEWHEVSATAYFDEYVVKSNPVWKDKPHIMIAKCAECLAIRKAFPANLSGIYGDDEMARAKAPTQPEEDITDEVTVTNTAPMTYEELVNYSANIVDAINGTKDRTYCLPYGPFCDFLKVWQDKIAGQLSLKVEVEKSMKDVDKFVRGFTQWRDKSKAKILEFKPA